VNRAKLISVLSLALLAFTSTAVASPTYTPHKYQQNDWFGEYGQNTSMYVNPAGIAEADQFEVKGAFFSSIGGAAMQEYATAVYPLGYNWTIGASFFENGATLDNGDSYTENAFLVGAAYRLFHWLAVGVDMSIIYINQFDVNNQLTLGLDVGLSWNPISNSKLGHLQIGVALQNIVPPVVAVAEEGVTDGGFKFVPPFSADGYQIPTNLNVSLFYRGLNRALEVKAEVSVLDILHQEAEGGKGMAIEFGVTGTYYITQLLGVRARFTKEGYPVIGATVNVKDVSFFKYIELVLEMSHDQLVEKKNRGFLWNVNVSARFGDTREEAIGEANYRRLKIEPENDYRAAMRLYLNRDFTNAAYAFGKVQTKYPTFHLVDQAAFYKAKSFENMRMHTAARSIYEEAIRKYPESDQVPKYHFQLMNIDYKEGDYAQAMIKYQFIVQNFPKSDVKPDADYIAGQIKFEQKQYQESIDLLQAILPGNANYFYARYTMGIAYSRLGKWDEAKASFEDIIAQPASNQSERDLQDAARIKLGHIYFSALEGTGEAASENIAKAAALYGEVYNKIKGKPQDAVNPIDEEAALALGWTFLKVNKPAQALQFSNWIINSRPNSYLVSEAYLVNGYCYYLQNDLTQSEAALSKAVELTSKPTISQAERDSAKTAYGEMKAGFDSIQVDVLSLARQLPTPRVNQKRAALQPKFDAANRAIENYAVFQQRVIQSDRFESNRKRVSEDAEFTLATVKTKLGQQGGGGGGAAPSQGLEELEGLEEL
jgi:TolA-binding protein